MGWGNCGTDSDGRPIGYVFEATCDEPGCDAEIDRGLSYACGGMHGETEYSCEKYFCERHLHFTNAEIDKDIHPWEGVFCSECAEWIDENLPCQEDDEEDLIINP